MAPMTEVGWRKYGFCGEPDLTDNEPSVNWRYLIAS